MTAETKLAMFVADSRADHWHARVFSGEIGRFGGMPELDRVGHFAREFVAAALDPHDPRFIHRHYDAAGLANLLTAVQRNYVRSEEAKAGWRALFAAAGLDPATDARDRLVLRFQPPSAAPRTASHISTATLGHHRDSWASNLYAQVNWWGPLYPLAPDRTMGLCPSYWNRALQNNSADFNMPELMKRMRSQPGSVKLSDLLPQPLASVDPADCVPVLIEPGELLVFSAQHLHGGRPNLSDETRVSLDTRTIRRADYCASHGAPNTDGSAPWAVPMLFRGIDDGRPFQDMIGTEAYIPYGRPSA